MQTPPVPQIAYIACDNQLQITESSLHASTLLGVPGEDLCGQVLTDIFLPLVGSEQDIDTVRNRQQPYMIFDQVNILSPDGDTTYISFVILPYGDGILGIISDVTRMSLQQQHIQQQHHELFLLHEKVASQNQQLMLLNEELKELSQRKSDMLAVATHDLRSPLSAILSYAELLQEGEFDPLTDEQKKAITIIQQEGQRMLTLIQTLLDLKRLETSVLAYRYPIHLDELIVQIVTSFENRARLVDVTVTYNPMSCAETREKLVVQGDRDILQQAVANLISNGIKYAGAESTVTIELSFLENLPEQYPPLDPSQLWCMVTVSDNGPGMKTEDTQHIFTPFFRTSEARRSNRDGVGLGLTIVHRAVQQHEGHITVHSNIGEGTTFTIFLPCTLESSETIESVT